VERASVFVGTATARTTRLRRDFMVIVLGYCEGVIIGLELLGRSVL